MDSSNVVICGPNCEGLERPACGGRAVHDQMHNSPAPSAAHTADARQWQPLLVHKPVRWRTRHARCSCTTVHQALWCMWLLVLGHTLAPLVAASTPASEQQQQQQQQHLQQLHSHAQPQHQHLAQQQQMQPNQQDTPSVQLQLQWLMPGQEGRGRSLGMQGHQALLVPDSADKPAVMQANWGWEADVPRALVAELQRSGSGALQQAVLPADVAAAGALPADAPAGGSGSRDGLLHGLRTAAGGVAHTAALGSLDSASCDARAPSWRPHLLQPGQPGQQQQQQQEEEATKDIAWGPQRQLLLDRSADAAKAIASKHESPGSPLTGAARAEAQAALEEAIARAETPQGLSGGPTALGLTLEERILLARLMGHEVHGSFDAISQLSANSKEYWQALEHQLLTSPNAKIRQMFEGTWYKCGKLNSGLTLRANTTRALEQNALPHVLAWLGLQELDLPRPGSAANFDTLTSILKSLNATAQLVLDPVPYLRTQQPPTDRNGFPMLIHMTFRDKDSYLRHHILSMASWALANPDYRILMYDDSDLQSYMSYDAATLALYNSLKTPVERSDLWRYDVMCKHGGVYTDADTLCIKPVQEWNRDNGHDAEVLLGAEDVFRRDPNGSASWGVRQGRIGVQFEQWTLAGAAQQPVFCRMGELISARLDIERSTSEAANAEPNWSILHRTGPHVWTDSVLQWMHEHDIGFHEALQPGGKLVQNTRIMPAETFGCAAHFFANDTRLDDVLVMHMFRGVWRTQIKHKRRHKSAKNLLTHGADLTDKATGNNAHQHRRRSEHLGF